MAGFQRGWRWLFLACLMVFVALSGRARLLAEETALDRYVAKPDSTYSWKIVRTTSDNGLTQYVVDLKSQTWRTEKDVDRPVWQHWLTVVKPARPATSL